MFHNQSQRVCNKKDIMVIVYYFYHVLIIELYKKLTFLDYIFFYLS